MRRYTRDTIRTLLAAAMVFAIGCAGDDTTIDPECDGPKCDAWNDANDPANFGRDYIYSFAELSKPELANGASEIVPWPDTYWPMKEDGYNDRWRGDSVLSPVELYDKAFNGWVPEGGFEAFTALKRFKNPGGSYDAAYYEKYGKATKWGHEKGGNYRARVLTAPDGTPQWDESSMEENIEWGGLEGWWGHCHAWAPAAFMAPEPQHAVTLNGVTFEVADIKALIEATYEGGNSLFLGGRCNTKDVERDEYGRIIADECRDTNAGAFHVVTLNRMGIRGLSFVLDATYDYQVWNQPVRDYTITQQDIVDLPTALELIKRSDVTEYPYNDDAESFVHVKMKFRYVVEGSASAEPFLARIDSFTRTHNYDYLLELDGDGMIIGGEWIDDNPHPDFLWAPTGANDVKSGGYWGETIIAKADVQQLIDLASAPDQPDDPPVNGDEHVYEATPGTAIPDNDSTGISSVINVSDALTVAAMRVTVDITHTYSGDLTLSLVRNGTTVELMSREGGSADDVHKTFPVSDFNGQDSAGDWTLKVVDSAGQDVGTLDAWTITIVTE